jgi:glycosyltransferase involved in cell wall biosynthesis
VRILAVNWLDLANPQAGGAELHCFEIFRRLAGRGHRVTLVTSGWPGAQPRAEIQGIDVRRFGGRHTFALLGRGAVRRALRQESHDVVVEDINKLPLYLPVVTRLPVYVIIPHLFGTTAFLEAAWPVATVVWVSERAIPRVYRGSAFHAISDSTRDDLVRRGVAAGAIRVIYPGVDAQWFAPDPETPRAPEPTFVYVGRLKRYKGLETLLRALARTGEWGYRFRLLVAGGGDDRGRLEGIARRLQLGGAVEFLGFVDEERKRALFRAAWAHVFPSPKEGWGLSNVEAAACGTPAVASDSPGLRESVLDGQTGILVPHGDPDALAAALVRLGTDPALVASLGRRARQFALTLSWDRAADLTEQHLLETIQHAQRKD